MVAISSGFVCNHFKNIESQNKQFLLDARYRTIGFMESNAFYRMIIQAYGAQERLSLHFSCSSFSTISSFLDRFLIEHK